MPLKLPQFDLVWPATLRALLPTVPPEDRDALLLWFQFHPLSLHLLAEPNSPEFERYYQLRGHYTLAPIADTSHRFLHSHSHWPQIKQRLKSLTPADTLPELIQQLGPHPALSAIALMTLRQAGPAFVDTPTAPAPPIVVPRASGQPRSLLGRLTARTAAPRIIFDERRPDAWFPILPGQHITTAAELDKRPYHEADERCYRGMGPIPVDCRSGSCGTCWVGILGGQENVAPLTEFERRRMAYFGYWDNPYHDAETEKPLIRLACQTIVQGPASIVIPPWNGVWGPSRQASRTR